MSQPSPSAHPHAPRPGLRSLRTLAPRLALVAVLALAPVLGLPLGASLSSLPTASAAPSDPRPAEPDASGGVSLDLIDGGATSLSAGQELALKVRLTNRGSEPLTDPALELRVRTDRITDRGTLAQWQEQNGPDTYGVPATTVDGPGEIAPGDSAELTLAVEADDLGFSSAPYLWGARRLSVTATDEGDPLASLRSFTVWRPEGADARVSSTVMLPVAATDPGAVVTDTDAFTASADKGRLKDLSDLAARSDVDWMLDPSLLDSPEVSDGSGGDDRSAGDDEGDQPSPAHYAVPDAASTLSDALASSAEDRDVLALPYAQSDAVSLKAAGTTDLQDALAERSKKVWEDNGIDPVGEATVIPGEEASGKTLARAVSSGADTLVVPSSSLRADPAGTVTPSSIGTFTSKGTTVPVLAPDPTLSAELEDLRSGQDVEQVRQRVIAETAVIASEQSSAPRQILIAPDLAGDMDLDAVTSTLDALDEVPWTKQAPVSKLLDAAEKDRMVTDTGTESGGLYALGALDAGDVRPSGPGDDGTWAHLPRARERDEVETETLESLQGSLRSLGTVTSIAQEDAPFSATRFLILSTTSSRLAGKEDRTSDRVQTASEQVASMRESIHVVPASGYNLVSDSAGVPITVTNGLDSPITVEVAVSTDRPIVRVGEPTTVEVPARQKKEVTVPIDAIANGTVTLTSSLRSEDGTELASPVSVPLNVNPAWENWTTLVLVGALGALVVVGVLRARRTGSHRRTDVVDDEGETGGAEAPDEENR
jgi:hypothetical protein